MKRFRVPDKDIKIKPKELFVINTPTFRRLYDIKQLGLAYQVYPFATHTRAAHSLECLDMAQKIIDALLENEPSLKEIINDKVVDSIRLSALIHDIMHIPFAHTLEDENNILSKGDRGPRIDNMINRLKKEILSPRKEIRFPYPIGYPTETEYESLKTLLEKVKEVLWTIAEEDKPEEKQQKEKMLENNQYFIADIIGNTISADLLSYIKRDVDFTGIEKRPGGWYRIFDYFTLAHDRDRRLRLAINLTKAGLRYDLVSAILGVLDVRYALTEQVTYHHAKCAASAMLGKVAQLCKLKESKELYCIGDEGFLKILKDKIEKLSSSDEESADSAKKILENLKSRRLFKRIYKVTLQERKKYDKDHEPGLADIYTGPSNREKLEQKIEHAFGLPAGSIIIFCPSSKMALKEAKTMVIYEKISEPVTESIAVRLNGDEIAVDYPGIRGRVEEIETRYESLWNLYVFIDPDKFGYAPGIQQRLKEELGVANDPHLELYLNKKQEYIKAKEEVKKPIEENGILTEEIVYQGLSGILGKDKSPKIDKSIVKKLIDEAHKKEEATSKEKEKNAQ